MNTLSYRIFHMLAGAWRRRYVIAIPLLLLPIVGLVIGIITPKHYSSHTSMLIQETAKMNPFLEDFAVSTMLKERMATLQTLLHSRHILGAVAEERGLVNKETTPQRRDEVIAQLSAALSVKMAGKDLIRIDYQSGAPNEMKKTLEVVSRQFIEQLLAPERSSMKDSSYFLAEHLETRRRELDRLEVQLADFIEKNATELPELHLTNISTLAKLKQRLSERQAEMAGAARSLGGLDQQLSKTNPVLGRLEEQIVRLRGELALLRARYTDRHSKVRAVLRNLRRLEEERQNLLTQTEHNVDVEQLWDIASSLPINRANSGTNDNGSQPLLISQLENLQLARAKVDGLLDETESLKQMIAELEKKSANYGAHASEMARLERDLGVKRELYDDLLQRHEKARITSSLGIFERDKRVKVIDRPFTPTAPSNLPLFLFVIAGLVGGVFLGSGMAMMLEIADTTLRRRDHLEALTGVPVLSRIPPIFPTVSKISGGAA